MRKSFFAKKRNSFLHTKASRNYYVKEKTGVAKKVYFWLFFIIILGLFYFFFYSNFFILKNIEITRAKNTKQKVSDEQVKNSVISSFLENKYLIFSKGNYFSFDKNAEANKIKNNFNLEQITINKAFPDKLKIIIEEKSPVASIAIKEKKIELESAETANEIKPDAAEPQKDIKTQENAVSTTTEESIQEYSYFLLDKRGDSLESVKEADPQLPLIYNEAEIVQPPYITEKNLSFILELYKKFPQRLEEIKINSYKIGESKESKITLVTDEGWEMYFDSMSDAREQLEKVVLILSKKTKDQRKILRYLDARFQDRVIVNPENF